MQLVYKTRGIRPSVIALSNCKAFHIFDNTLLLGPFQLRIAAPVRCLIR